MLHPFATCIRRLSGPINKSVLDNIAADSLIVSFLANCSVPSKLGSLASPRWIIVELVLSILIKCLQFCSGQFFTSSLLFVQTEINDFFSVFD